MDGAGAQKYKWFLYCEWRLWVFYLTYPFHDDIFLEGCTIKNFTVTKWDRVFFLGRFIYASLLAQKKQHESQD